MIEGERGRGRERKKEKELERERDFSLNQTYADSKVTFSLLPHHRPVCTGCLLKRDKMSSQVKRMHANHSKFRDAEGKKKNEKGKKEKMKVREKNHSDIYKNCCSGAYFIALHPL